MFASMFKSVLPLSLAFIAGTTTPAPTAANRAPESVVGTGQDEVSIQGRFRRDWSDRQTAAISLIGLLGTPMDDGRGGTRPTTCRDISEALELAGLGRDARIVDTESLLFITGSTDRIRAAESLIETMRTTRDAASQSRALNVAVYAMRTHASLLVDQARAREDAVRSMGRQAGSPSPLVRAWLDTVIRDACADVRRVQAYEQAVLAYATDPAHFTAPREPAPLTAIPGLPFADERLECRIRDLERALACANREREESETRLRCAVRDLDRVREQLECAHRELAKAQCEARDARREQMHEREEARRREACLVQTIEDLKRQLGRSHPVYGGDRGETGPKRGPDRLPDRKDPKRQ